MTPIVVQIGRRSGPGHSAANNINKGYLRSFSLGPGSSDKGGFASVGAGKWSRKRLLESECVELDRVHLYLLLEYVSDMEGLRGFQLQIDVDTVSVNAEL